MIGCFTFVPSNSKCSKKKFIAFELLFVFIFTQLQKRCSHIPVQWRIQSKLCMNINAFLNVNGFLWYSLWNFDFNHLILQCENAKIDEFQFNDIQPTTLMHLGHIKCLSFWNLNFVSMINTPNTVAVNRFLWFKRIHKWCVERITLFTSSVGCKNHNYCQWIILDS